MKNNNSRAVAIPDNELLYIKTTIEWLSDNTELIDHNRTQQETIYNSVQNSLDSIERARDKANTKISVLHIFSVSNWQMYFGIGCIMMGIVGIAIAFVFACC